MSAEPLLPPLPEPNDAQWRRHRYTEADMIAYARSAQAAAQGMTEPSIALVDWLRSQNLIAKE